MKKLLNDERDSNYSKDLIRDSLSNNSDMKMASILTGHAGQSFRRPLVFNNVPKDKFPDLNFNIGDRGTYFYNFEKRMQNFARSSN